MVIYSRAASLAVIGNRRITQTDKLVSLRLR